METWPPRSAGAVKRGVGNDRQKSLEKWSNTINTFICPDLVLGSGPIKFIMSYPIGGLNIVVEVLLRSVTNLSQLK